VRGLKYIDASESVSTEESHPAWGAWIEVLKRALLSSRTRRRTPHGVRGLKFYKLFDKVQILSRTPHGVRGLKSYCS